MKRKTLSGQLDRLYKILYDSQPTTAEVAAHLGISTKTVSRYVYELRRAGYNILTFGRNGNYRYIMEKTV